MFAWRNGVDGFKELKLHFYLVYFRGFESVLIILEIWGFFLGLGVFWPFYWFNGLFGGLRVFDHFRGFGVIVVVLKVSEIF